jgi:hypothetical protein
MKEPLVCSLAPQLRSDGLRPAPDANAQVWYFRRYGYYYGGPSLVGARWMLRIDPQQSKSPRFPRRITRLSTEVPMRGSGWPTFLFLCS